MMSSETTSGIVRRKGACTKCRQRKTRCDGAPICSQCKRSNLPCSYNKPYNVSEVRDASGLKSRPSSRRSMSREENWMFHALDYAATVPLQQELAPESVRLPMNTAPIVATPVQSEISRLDQMEAWEFLRDSTGQDGLVTPPFDNLSNLDHDVQLGPDHEWSSFWALNMCRDFSSLSPMHSISRHIRNDTLRTMARNVSTRLSRKVAKQHSPQSTSCALDWTQFGGSSLYDLERAASYVDAFFDDCYSLPDFISRDETHSALIDMTLETTSANHCTAVLINSVLATGSRLVSKRLDNTVPADLAKKPQQYFKAALDSWQKAYASQPRLEKLQAVSTLALYASKGCDIALARSLLSEAVHLIHFLMPSLGECSANSPKSEERRHFEGSFWLIYSIEKPFMMRFGGHSMIDDELIMFPPPLRARKKEAPDEFDWVLLHYRYARLCSLIVKTLYGRFVLKLSQSDTMAAISGLQQALETWRLSIPERHRPLNAAQESPLQAYEHCMRADLQIKHAEAGLAINRWAIVCSRSLSVGGDTAYSSSLQYCIQLVEGLLNGTRLLDQESNSGDWMYTYIPLLAAVVVFIAAVKTEPRGEYFAYLGIACGCFGWLKRRIISNSEPDLLDEVNQLSSIANRLLHEHENPMMQSGLFDPEGAHYGSDTSPIEPVASATENSASLSKQTVDIPPEASMGNLHFTDSIANDSFQLWDI